MATKIEWTDEVWNPVTGCTKVSQGCKNCYAERIANRFWGERKFTDVICHEDRLDIPLKWRKPRRVFVNSMSDLFHEDVSSEFILHVLAVTLFSKQHTYQILTKRPKRMFELLSNAKLDRSLIPLENVWLGVSIEDQATVDERIPWLLKTPAAVRFVSYEPALGPVDLSSMYNVPNSDDYPNRKPLIAHLDWIIAGGETCPGARPAHPDWFRSVAGQCVEAGVPFFFKGWGEWMPCDNFVHCPENTPFRFPDGQGLHRVGKKMAGRELDGIVWNEYPEVK